jgi:hypothetical protein
VWTCRVVCPTLGCRVGLMGCARRAVELCEKKSKVIPANFGYVRKSIHESMPTHVLLSA